MAVRDAIGRCFQGACGAAASRARDAEPAVRGTSPAAGDDRRAGAHRVRPARRRRRPHPATRRRRPAHPLHPDGGRAGRGDGGRRAHLHRAPGGARSKIWSNNPIGRLNRELKRRTDVVGIFPDKASVIRIVRCLLVEINDEMIAAERRYIAAASLADLTAGTAEPALPAAPRPDQQLSGSARGHLHHETGRHPSRSTMASRMGRGVARGVVHLGRQGRRPVRGWERPVGRRRATRVVVPP